MNTGFRFLISVGLSFVPLAAWAYGDSPHALDLSGNLVGYVSLILFGVAYVFVVLEEMLELRKSKPMMLAAALIWVAIALVYKTHGLSELAYLHHLSGFLYGELGATPANMLVGVNSALIDNIPVMFAILSMHPDMSTGQLLLVTLTAGVGGSLRSVGSAAGVALTGQAKGIYAFMTHLKWAPAIGLGYFGSIGVHFLINSELF